MLLRMTLLLFTAAAAVKDRESSRISNVLIGGAVINGLFLQFYENSWSGLLSAALGMSVPLVLCGWLFVLAMLGAGDVKLLMAVGIYTGPKEIVGVIVLAFISGAVMSLAKLIKYGLIRERMYYLLNYVQQIMAGESGPYIDMTCPEKNEKWTIPFAVPVFMAVVMLIAADWGRMMG